MILKRGISLSGKKVPIGRIIGTVINTLLIIVVLLTAGVLMLSSLKGGTFEIFGKSWYYYQSDAMTGEIERNEMVIIEDISPSDFENGDIVAFYTKDATGERVIQIAQLLQYNGSRYQLTETSGEPFIVDSSETVFLGKVVDHSERLGELVQQMKTEDGKKIFRSWSLVLLLLVCGIIIMLHVQRERSHPLPEAEDDYYDQYEAYSDEDYPQERGMRLSGIPQRAPARPAYDYDEYDRYDEYDQYDEYADYEQNDYDNYDNYGDYDDEWNDQSVGYVDEDNMDLIARNTESEDEEENDFDAIFREIRRQTGE